MHGSLRVAVLVTGMLSLLMAADGFTATRLEEFVARLKGLDPAGKRAAMRSLSNADRKALHHEYRALSADARKAVDIALGRGKARSARAKSPKGGLCTVQYDTGSPHSLRDNWGSVVGNNFNTGFGDPHTITVVTFSMNGTFANTPVRLYGAPVGTVAPVIASTSFAGLPIGTLVQWDVNPNVVGHIGQFLGGVEQSGSFSSINTTFVGVQIDANLGPLGFHGMNINLAGSGYNPNATVGGQAFSAIFRATMDCVPVELMHFDLQR